MEGPGGATIKSRSPFHRKSKVEKLIECWFVVPYSDPRDRIVYPYLTYMEEFYNSFIIAGETSAGKSSVLNLLFGEDLLPVHTKSCTATITNIRYGQHRRARIIYRDDKEPLEIDKLDDAGKKTFNDIVFMANEREEHDIKEVQVFCPLWFLKVSAFTMCTTLKSLKRKTKQQKKHKEKQQQ